MHRSCKILRGSDLKRLGERCIGFKSRGRENLDWDRDLERLLREGMRPALRHVRLAGTSEERHEAVSEMLDSARKTSRLRWSAQLEVLEAHAPGDLLEPSGTPKHLNLARANARLKELHIRLDLPPPKKKD